ncbi:Mur ligase family protein [Thermodesulfobacteriota bacterium]
MRYRLHDIPDLLRTPIGRRQMLHGIYIRTTPILYWAAFLYRLTIIRKTRIIAVVGSFGKTTTTRCLLKVFAGRIHKRHEQNAGVSLARNILRIKPWQRYAVIEIGISAIGQMEKSAKIVRPDITVVTSIGSEHNRSFKTLEVTRREKSKMVTALNKNGAAVLNDDDPNVRGIKTTTGAKIITFGTGEGNDVKAVDIIVDWPRGTRFTLYANNETRHVNTSLIGKHMTYPVLSAVAVGLYEGKTLDNILGELEAIEPTEGRMQPVTIDSGAVILRDDFKSSLETIDRAFDVVADIHLTKRKILVIGEVSEPPGSAGPIYRRLGERITGLFSKAYIICNNTGFSQYKSGAVRAGFSKDRLIHFKRDEISKLIENLKNDVRPDDIILIKGRHSQRLGRIAFALQGCTVKCTIGECDARSTYCHNCPMLEKGWEGRKVLI